MTRRFPLPYALPVLALLVWAVLPLVSGRATLYLRDVSNAHVQSKIVQARQLRTGAMPLVDPQRDGQPLVGNPNTVALYPTTVLGVIAPARWSMNAHFWLHLLAAPFAFFALGRAAGLRPPAAWAAATIYATCGFALSHMNLLNSVAIMALAPAAAAASVAVMRARSRPCLSRATAALALLVGLLVVGGDPPSAAFALALAASAGLALMRRTSPPRRSPQGLQPRHASARQRTLAALAAAGLGLLVAAPQLIELGRIASTSMRGGHQASARAVLAQSLDPRSSTEWLLPLAFGAPDNSFWGRAVYGGNEPFYLSLFPGCLALVLVAASGRPRTRAAWWAWAAVAAGGFLALGGYNPLIRLAVESFGGLGLRYPIKAWLLVAVGASLLAGFGFERLASRRGRRRLLLATALVFALYAGLAWLFGHPPAALRGALGELAPQRLVGSAITAELTRWSALAFLAAALLGADAGLLWLAGRRRALAGGLLLALHTVSQLFFLAPLLDTDDAGFYHQPPAILDAVPETPWVVHGRTGNLFGPPPAAARDPDPRTLWDERRRFASLAPQAGVLWGRRYAFDPSPEGLDSYWSVAVAQALRQLGDLDRLRLLEAAGVHTLILDRRLAPEAAQRAGVVAEARAEGQPVWVYKLGHAAAPISVAAEVRFTTDPNLILEHLRDPEFDPRTAVVLRAERDIPRRLRRPGRVDVAVAAAERVVADVDSPEGAVLVVQRAWLPIYRASVDGVPAPVAVANLFRVAVEVPPGLHRVRLWVDRRPFHLGWLLSAFGLAAIMVLGRRARRSRA